MIEESVWLRCFWEIYEVAKKEGKETIEFANVDKLVLERCQLPLKEFMAWLYPNVKEPLKLRNYE